MVLAGYTNSGKSSLLNRMTGAGVLVEDALFATLDPTVRKASTPSGRLFTLADTVGFVRHLPHQLVEAFRSTLEEVSDADLILHVVDGSDDFPEGQIAAVREVLAEIGAGEVPELIVINKSDIADPLVVGRIRSREPHSVVVSAATGAGIPELLAAVELDLPNPTRAGRRCSSPSTAATSWPGSTRRAATSRSSTSPRAPRSARWSVQQLAAELEESRRRAVRPPRCRPPRSART